MPPPRGYAPPHYVPSYGCRPVSPSYGCRPVSSSYGGRPGSSSYGRPPVPLSYGHPQLWASTRVPKPCPLTTLPQLHPSALCPGHPRPPAPDATHTWRPTSRPFRASPAAGRPCLLLLVASCLSTTSPLPRLLGIDTESEGSQSALASVGLGDVGSRSQDHSTFRETSGCVRHVSSSAEPLRDEPLGVREACKQLM